MGGSVAGIWRAEGTVFCTPDGNIGTIAATSTPVSPNIVVHMQSRNGSIVSTTTTNNMGFLASFLDEGEIVVTSPMSYCNAMLPSTGYLTSRMQYIGTILKDDNIEMMKVTPNNSHSFYLLKMQVVGVNIFTKGKKE
ncbi:hypothetical protein Csa_011394 [Cucumis sativus]|uniref:Uncharacterized protein n=1 Tax=Cucumis sativus TaxID=3659 RepID=A0A0A0LAL8_CUCSA|nr:hypothetical protein Csa_011394 [Cucumis sativus]